mmetsp:Transcript_12485/g.49978  ORF Transcript_12485/g.49978 Transcript_12485/m.49978 type:complete len:505 (+) Transcript_12485:418-1932(+)
MQLPTRRTVHRQVPGRRLALLHHALECIGSAAPGLESALLGEVGERLVELRHLGPELLNFGAELGPPAAVGVEAIAAPVEAEECVLHALFVAEGRHLLRKVELLLQTAEHNPGRERLSGRVLCQEESEFLPSLHETQERREIGGGGHTLARRCRGRELTQKASARYVVARRRQEVGSGGGQAFLRIGSGSASGLQISRSLSVAVRSLPLLREETAEEPLLRERVRHSVQVLPLQLPTRRHRFAGVGLENNGRLCHVPARRVAREKAPAKSRERESIAPLLCLATFLSRRGRERERANIALEPAPALHLLCHCASAASARAVHLCDETLLNDRPLGRQLRPCELFLSFSLSVSISTALPQRRRQGGDRRLCRCAALQQSPRRLFRSVAVRLRHCCREEGGERRVLGVAGLRSRVARRTISSKGEETVTSVREVLHRPEEAGNLGRVLAPVVSSRRSRRDSGRDSVESCRVLLSQETRGCLAGALLHKEVGSLCRLCCRGEEAPLG